MEVTAGSAPSGRASGPEPTTFRIRAPRFAGVVEIALTQSLIDAPYARALAGELRLLLMSGPTVVVLNGSGAGFMVEASGDADPTLSSALAELLEVVLTSGAIIISVCGGHAVGIGALLLLVSDYRIALAGSDWRLALPALFDGRSMSVPTARFVQELVSPGYQRRLIVGERFGPLAAADAGFIDEFCDIAVVDARLAELILRLTASGTAWRLLHHERLRSLAAWDDTRAPALRRTTSRAGARSGGGLDAPMTTGATSPPDTSPAVARTGAPRTLQARDGRHGTRPEPAHQRVESAGDGARRG